VKAAFTKEGDLFAEKGVLFLDTFVNLSKPDLFERQMWEEFQEILGLWPEENRRAVEQGYRSLSYFDSVTMRGAAREVLDQLEREDRLGVVLLGRPYHNDPGVNHEILEEFQKLGYPVFAQDSLPIDDDMLWRLFGDEVRAGAITHPLAITDVWKNSYSENTSRKVWAAKYVARHPNLVALELSSFKCGHDAPIYSVVEEIVEHSGTPYFCFKDIDENKPTGICPKSTSVDSTTRFAVPAIAFDVSVIERFPAVVGTERVALRAPGELSALGVNVTYT